LSNERRKQGFALFPSVSYLCEAGFIDTRPVRGPSNLGYQGEQQENFTSFWSTIETTFTPFDKSPTTDFGSKRSRGPKHAQHNQARTIVRYIYLYIHYL